MTYLPPAMKQLMLLVIVRKYDSSQAFKFNMTTGLQQRR